MRRKHIILFVVVMFLTWNMLMYFTVVNKNPGAQVHNHGNMQDKIIALQDQIESQLEENQKILTDLRKLKEMSEQKQKKASNEVVSQVREGKPNGTGLSDNKLSYDKNSHDNVVLPILMIACDRADAVARSLDLVLKYRPDPKRFPIIVSQDCGHQATSEMIQKYVKDQDILHIKQPDLGSMNIPWPQRKFEGYYKISRHYKFALNQVFNTLKYSAVIIVEDDLDIAPDFYEYFAATYRILAEDESLWCVSAWNDNGKSNLVNDDPELLHRTDFFPGLGWMMRKTLWDEIGPKWPETFWDDWMRHPDQRKGRSCIRPELCRTSTFGKKGVSKGLFFDKHLKFIKLNQEAVPFTEKDLSYLKKEKYDPAFREHIYSLPEVTASEVKRKTKSELPEVRVTYKDDKQFKEIAKALGIMDDFRAGVQRTAYMGVVSFSYDNKQRVHVAPVPGWTEYNLNWN